MQPSIAILQFGTSRFLQAHADLFISDALARGEALGTIAVVQTTSNPASSARLAALADEAGYPVRIRGIQNGKPVDQDLRGFAIRKALRSDRDWPDVRRIAVDEAQVILSNTGDRGFDLDPSDDASLLAQPDQIPRSFPAKLAILLHERWRKRPYTPLSIFPCELISGNGDKLREIVCGLGLAWQLGDAFLAYLRDHVCWANSLVDRIVSEPILPVGAVAEPYALWAIEQQVGLVLPCQHDAIVVTGDLIRYERLKLHILNLGHSYLAEQWLADGGPADLSVLDAMRDPAMRQALEAAWSEEVVPVFAAEALGDEAEAYVETVRDRFLNPFLAHRIADIAQNHTEKKRRRMAPVVATAERLGLAIPQLRLRQALSR